jgi:hypothetical protein
MAEGPIAAMALRELEERSRGLPLEAQMMECVDLLQSPELVVDELLRSIEQIRTAGPETARVELRSEADARSEGAFFYPSRELFVRGDRCSFTCLATAIEFAKAGSAPPAVTADGPRYRSPHAIDYAAVTCEARPVPVLGFTAASESESAYPILLRALASLIELTRPRRFDLLDRTVYRGLLGPAPAFDLALVLWDEEGPEDPRRPLCELSRDLAEVLKKALRDEPRFPPVLLDFVCLRMNAKRFDGRLRFAWRV